jgi:putative membrane protein
LSATKGEAVFFSPAEADAIETRIASLEARTGAQVVTAIVGKSDGYPEVVWKAFALGVAVAALAVFVCDFVKPDWITAYATWFNVVPMLAAGAVSALLAIAVPDYARLYLNRLRAAGEVRQYAQALFLERQLFRTRARNGVLILASLFERKVELLADIGFAGRVDDTGWRAVVDTMTPLLASARPAEALLRALDRIEALLLEKGFAPADAAGDELPNRPIEAESGA